MADNKILVGTAMLNAVWSKQHNDMLDLILPFVKYAIGRKYKKGDRIEPGEIAACLNEELGYESIPHEVVATMLKRLSPSVLDRRRGEFWLKVGLEKDVKSYSDQRLAMKERHEKVGSALAAYLNEKMPRSRFDAESALDSLLGYFCKNGLLVAKAAKEIDFIKKGQAAQVDYLVGQFILKENEKNSAVFGYMLEMVRGSFVSSAIYLQPNNYSMKSSRFKETTCYLDTRIILNLLELNSEQEYQSSKQLINMLEEMGARIACFQHTVEEVGNIIRAYKHSLQNPAFSPSPFGPTLPAWDASGVTLGEIDSFLAGLRVRLHRAGIAIEDDPDCPLPQNYPIDENGLSVHLSKEMNYGNEAALRRDVKSVAFVSINRAGRRTPSIEKCKAVFVTSNPKLVEAVEKFLHCRHAESVSPVVLASKLASVVWLKCFATHGDYPKVKLLEDAMVATAPSEEVLSEFYRLVEKMKAKDGISSEEAAAIRSGLFQARELMSSVDGDASRVSEESVEMVTARLRDRYAARERAERDSARAEADRAEAEMAKKKECALRKIDEAGERAKMRVRMTLGIAVKAIWTILFVAATVLVAYACIAQNVGFGAWGIVLLALEIVSVCDVFFGKWKIVDSMIEKCAESFGDKAKDREREQFDFLFE